MSINFNNRSLFFNNRWQKNITKKRIKRSFNDKTILFKSSNNTDLTRLILSSKKQLLFGQILKSIKKIILKKISNVLKENRAVIAKYMMIDTGKSYVECYQELTFCCKLWNEATKVNKKFLRTELI